MLKIRNPVFSLAILFGPITASAEYALMVAADNYCKAEIRIGEYGNGNPESLPIKYSGSVTKGQTWSGAEGLRVCARRSGNGVDCSSGLTNWYCISPYKDLDQGKARSGEF